MLGFAKLLRRLVPLLPRRIRQVLVRRQVNLPVEIPQSITTKIVNTTAELEQCFRLIYQSYLPLGYCSPNSHEMYASIYHALPTTTTLVAKDGERVVGTLTVVRDNRLGLPLERSFKVGSLRTRARRLAEITSLVVHPDYRRANGGAVLFALLKLMYQYSTRHFGVNHLVIAVHPKSAFFYTDLLMFRKIFGNPVKDYLGAPARVLELDLAEAHHRYKKAFSGRPRHKDLFDFFVERDFVNVQLPERVYHRINDPLVDQAYFKTLFLERLNVTSRLTGDERRKIENVFKYTDGRRRNPRVEVEIPVELVTFDRKVRAKAVIKDLSRFGFRAYFLEEIPADFSERQKVFAAMSINGESSELELETMWMNSDQSIGFLVEKADRAWHKYVSRIYKDHFFNEQQASAVKKAS